MIYFDNGATTKCYDKVVDIFKKYALEDYFNPSALYHEAIAEAKEVQSARENLINMVNFDGNLIFTASGSEADNLALLCSKKRNGGKIIVSNSEHSAIYQTAKELERRGYEVIFAPVDSTGRVIIEEFEKLLDNKVCLVSIMHVNNETGAINDIEKIAKLSKKYSPKCLVHSDGVQAFGKLKLNLNRLGVDMYSISGHKIHSPKGIGGLFVRKGVNLSPIIYGGGQEFNVRSATENVPYIKALEYSANEVYDNFDEKYSKKIEIIEYIRNEVLNNIQDVICLTPKEEGRFAPHIISFAFKDVRGEVLMHTLEKDGYIVGIGSACSSHKGTGRIQQAIGLNKDYEKGELRISISEFNTLDEAKGLVNKLIKNVTELREYVQK